MQCASSETVAYRPVIACIALIITIADQDFSSPWHTCLIRGYRARQLIFGATVFTTGYY